MTNEHATRAGAGFAALWLIVLVLVDVAVPASIAPDPLFALAPLFAASVMRARETAYIAGCSVLLVVLSGWWNDSWGHPQQWVLLLDVVLVGGAAVVIAEVRVRRERRFLRMANIADVAQRALLPTLPAVAGGTRVAARYQSAAADAVVGGDLYDCSLVGGHVRFLVGDVRGKGIAAVEQAARVIRAFRQSAALGPTLPVVAAEMDSYVTPFLGEEDFVTALLVDVSERDRLTLVSCGHPPPLLVRPSGEASLLALPGALPLGLGGLDRQAVTVDWRAGDRLLLYTDGLSEARDADGEFLSLTELAPALATATPDAGLDCLLETVRRHVKGGELNDDLAVVLLESTGTEAPTG